MNKKRKLNKKKLLLFFFMIVFLIMLILSAIKIISYIIDNKENKKIRNKTVPWITYKITKSDID